MSSMGRSPYGSHAVNSSEPCIGSLVLVHIHSTNTLQSLFHYVPDLEFIYYLN